MASRFGATIIPLASVGVEETTPILLDSQDLLKIPFVGDYLTKRAASYPQARKGVSASDDLKDTFIQVGYHMLLCKILKPNHKTQ